jgi:hypothetical protein
MCFSRLLQTYVEPYNSRPRFAPKHMAVELASRGKLQTHVEPYNSRPRFAPKHMAVELASRGKLQTHVEPYNNRPRFAPIFLNVHVFIIKGNTFVISTCLFFCYNVCELAMLRCVKIKK